ncbi:MAG: hypothetical protein K8H86_04825, partial [Ignavibacteriaceae bacterium]|nr:hypothetical protein [Ignavibacteriaceae bacterium]
MIKYFPLVSERILFSVGGGAGFSKATKRVAYKRNNLFLLEYETNNSSSVSLIGEVEAGLLITQSFGINVITYTLYADK